MVDEPRGAQQVPGSPGADTGGPRVYKLRIDGTLRSGLSGIKRLLNACMLTQIHVAGAVCCVGIDPKSNVRRL